MLYVVLEKMKMKQWNSEKIAFKYSWFHKKGTFSVHSFNDNYLSIPERPGS